MREKGEKQFRSTYSRFGIARLSSGIASALVLCFGLIGGTGCFRYFTGSSPELSGIALLASAGLGGGGLNQPDCVCVTEGGVTDSYTVVLSTQPLADVVVTVSPSDQVMANNSATPITLVFTSQNYNQPQTVSVAAVDDSAAEGAHFATITNVITAGDPDFLGKDLGTVSVTITDNDSSGVSVDPLGTVNVTEGGATDMYTVVLTSQPSASVVVTVSSDSQSSTDKTTLTFTTGDWNVAQTVTVTAVNDLVAEGAHISLISHTAASADPGYNGISITGISAAITDNETAGVSITETGGTNVTEGGATDTYTIVLTSQPVAPVTVNIGTDSQVTENQGGSVSFTTGNWNVAQTVTVTAVNDLVAEGVHNSTITHLVTTADPMYGALTPNSVLVTIADNDTAGVSITETGGTNVTEGGATDTYTIVLTSQPTASVTVNISTDSQVTENQSGSVTFTTGNWNSAQTVTVTAVNDLVAEGVHGSTITHSVTSADTTYSAITPNPVSITITDNDSAAVSITETGGTNVTEGGVTDTYTIVLTSQPTAGVTVNISTDSQVTENQAGSVAFTTGNWNVAQTVTVTAVNDLIAEGAHNSTITHSVTSADTTYSAITPNSVSVAITDNDTAGYTISAISGPTNESGTTATFTVRLNTEPTGTVIILLMPGDLTEGSVSPGSLSFNATNWSSNQTVTVTGVADGIVDGDITYNVVLQSPSGTDTSGYLLLNPPDVSVTNWDNNVRHIFRTNSKFNGNMGGPTGADALCNSQAAATGYPGSYKALLMDGINNQRIACMNANCGTPAAGDHTDWVLLANTSYYRAEDSAFIGTTTALRIFNFDLSAAWSSDPDTTWPNNHHWSGMASNWRPASFVYVGSEDCLGWTTNSGETANFGQTWVVDVGAINTGSNVSCGANLRLICVEQ